MNTAPENHAGTNQNPMTILDGAKFEGSSLKLHHNILLNIVWRLLKLSRSKSFHTILTKECLISNVGWAEERNPAYSKNFICFMPGLVPLASLQRQTESLAFPFRSTETDKILKMANYMEERIKLRSRSIYETGANRNR